MGHSTIGSCGWNVRAPVVQQQLAFPAGSSRLLDATVEIPETEESPGDQTLVLAGLVWANW